MATLPSASTRLASQSARSPVSTDLIAVFAACVSNADEVPRLYSNTQAALDEHGYCEGIEYGAIHLEDTGKPFLFVPLPIVTAGAIKRSESVHTGTSDVTVAVGANGALAEVDALVNVTRGGTVGTDQILLEYSLDGGTTYKPARLGTALTYTVPNIGVVITFGHGTLVTGDEILQFTTTAPLFDSTGIAAGKAGMIAQQLGVRSWLFVGDMPSLAMTQAVETAVNAYETSAERYVYAKAQMRDRKVLESSRIRCALVPATNATLTFAEVGATGDTITRTSGSFVTDGFQAGDWIVVTGSVSNNVSGKITGVTATVLTLDTTDLAAETLASGGAITAEPTFIFATPGETITRNRGSWIAEGFAVGDTVTIAGTASNNGTAIITTLTATVMTCAASTFVAETIGSCTASVTLTESDTAWRTAIEALVAVIDDSKRIDLGAGRLKKISPITGFKMRRPVQWADSVRSYNHDPHVATWWKALGSLEGWDIDGEHDERVDGGLLAARFTCARTWGNGPSGAYIAESLTRAVDGTLLSFTHNLSVANIAQTSCQRTTEEFVGQSLVTNPANDAGEKFAKKSSLAVLEAKVNADLKRNLLTDGGEGQRASVAKWSAATDDDFAVADATLHGTCDLELEGTIVHISTSVRVK